MFKIGEFSKLTQVSVRMLRYYDEIGLLKPMEIDRESGYRMYGTHQIPDLNKIIYLRDSGFQTMEIRTILQDETKLMEELRQKHREVEQSIHAEKEKLKKIEIAQSQLQKEASDIHFQIVIKAIPSYYVLSLRKVISNYYAEGELWAILSKYAKEHHIDVSQTCFTRYHDEEYKETDVDVELCVPVAKKGIDQGDFRFYEIMAVPEMATMMVYGDFSNIAKAYQAFARWMQEHHQYKMKGANRQIVHRGPWNETDEKKFLVELQIPLEK